MKKDYHAKVAATGIVLPKTCYTNDQIIEKINAATQGRDDVPELRSDWIEENIGIRTRYYFDETESLVDASAKACEQALSQAGWRALDLDFVILCSISSHADKNGAAIPSSACLVQEQLGAYNAFAYDSLAACSGWVYGMAQGVAFIESKMAKRGAVICAEKQSVGLNYADHRSSVLIGDVATVTLLESSEQPQLGAIHLQANDEKKLSSIISLPYFRHDDDGHYQHGHFALKGQAVFKEGIRTMMILTEQALQVNELSLEDVDWFVYHQANAAMLRMVGRKLGIPDEKNLMNIDRLGNTTAGTIPSVLAMYMADGTIKRGDTVCCVAFGGGLTAGSVVFTY